MLKLVKPTHDYKKQVLEYKKEFEKYNESMDGTAGLANASSFEEWFEACEDNSAEETVRDGLVPATTLLALDGDKLVGMIDIRHRLNEYLMQVGGHIGYSVRKSERCKGYATEMLKLGTSIANDLGIRRVLVTCDKDNIASSKVIIKNGGVLENEVNDTDRIVQRYWIDHR